MENFINRIINPFGFFFKTQSCFFEFLSNILPYERFKTPFGDIKAFFAADRPFFS